MIMKRRIAHFIAGIVCSASLCCLLADGEFTTTFMESFIFHGTALLVAIAAGFVFLRTGDNDEPKELNEI